MNDFLSIHLRSWFLGAMVVGCVTGCSQHHAFVANSKQTKEADRQLLKQVSYEEVATPTNERADCAPAPFALDSDSATVAYWDLTLDEAIQIALANSTVLRDLGARIIQTPQATPTIYN